MHKRTNTSFLAKVIPLGVGLFWATAAAQCSVPDSRTQPLNNWGRSYFALLLDGPIPNNVNNTKYPPGRDKRLYYRSDGDDRGGLLKCRRRGPFFGGRRHSGEHV